MFASPGAIAFQIPQILGFGPFPVRWYGILMATSIVVGLWWGHRQARRDGLPADDLISVGQWAILAGLVGALVGVLLAWKWRVPVLRGLDVTAPAIVLGQAIGRWGNFFNEEAFGRPTNVPWKLYISPAHRPPGFGQFEYFHPTFLYESLWDFAVFLLLVAWLRPRLREHPGALFFTYIGLYSIGRFAIEALRLDSFWVGQFRVPQLASLAGVIVALIGVAWTYRRTRPA